MGCEDHPPAHVPSHVVPVSNALLQLGGGIWTVCYVMLVVSAGRTKSYGMPMFALALNLAWEGVYALLVPGAQTIEKIGFATWLIIDCGLIHGLLTSGRRYEWAHAPLVQRHLGKIFAIMCLGCTLLHYGFATWWIANGVGVHRGKLYGGKVGPDMTELAFWSASVCQACLSVTSLCQLVIRGHSGGVSWTVWALRASGTLLGMHGYYGWRWFFWPEAHEYIATPMAVVILGSAFLADWTYPFVFAYIRRTEHILPDGRRISGQKAPELSSASIEKH
ncbi:hypothetical protein EXIGLDRAFT_620555 [Exidia glandulosa HHB12029]|uniref:Uncharacterized protein n=1 Tax=Exidia glandulosa HHB12029 TaxID=1314781 RepID=A0A165ERD4_EXIGL|nr:hypothetical protein EXIGLDRAFT_620555 [Exidia glandulosa HHB12029]